MKVAAVQMASGPNVSYNLIEAGRLIALAAQGGAELVVLPENFAIMGMAPQDMVKIREPLGKGPIQDFLAEQAQKQGIWLIGGTLEYSYLHIFYYRAGSELECAIDPLIIFKIQFEALSLFVLIIRDG